VGNLKPIKYILKMKINLTADITRLLKAAGDQNRTPLFGTEKIRNLIAVPPLVLLMCPTTMITMK
jgi:hypothetical protein